MIVSALDFYKKLTSELNRMCTYDIPIRIDGKLIDKIELVNNTIQVTTVND